MARPERVPDILPLNEVYLDGESMYEDIAEYAGSRRLLHMAQAVGVNRDTLRRLRARENASMQVETYARICAVIGRPYGSWLKCRANDKA